MLMVASAYAADPPLPEQINGGATNIAPVIVTANVQAIVQNMPPITVTADVDEPSSASLGVPGVIQQSWLSPLQNSNPHVYVFHNKLATNDKKKDSSGCTDFAGDPIQVSTGSKIDTYAIFQLPGEMGLSYIMYYNTSLGGGNWSSNLSYGLDLMCSASLSNGACGYVTYGRPDGSSLTFNGAPGVGPFTESGGGGLATLTYNASTATYTLHDEDATTKTFIADASGQAGELTSITDPSGVGWTITQTLVNGISTYTVTHTNGQSYTMVSGQEVITQVGGREVYSIPTTVTDPAGNQYGIHDTLAEFDQISYPGSPATVISFVYDPVLINNMTEVDYNGTPYSYTTYITASTDPHYKWANGTYLADYRKQIAIAYSTDSAGNTQAQLTNALGHATTQTYDGTNGSGGAYNGFLSTTADTAVTSCGATANGRAYDANGNLSETIDNNGNVHTYQYAVSGQLQTETEAFGSPNARTTNYVWDPNLQLNRLLSATVVGWKKTSYTYTAQNRLASVSVTNLSGTGTANQTLTTTYNYTLYGNGMVQTMTVSHPSPSGSNTDTYSYDTRGNLTSVSNGLGQTSSYSNYNGLNEVGHVVGPNGDATDYVYDARGRVQTKTTYPNGTAATWTSAYDGFGLLYTLTGPDGQVTTWNRNPSNMLVANITHNDKDGLSTETFTYDMDGNIIEDDIARGGVTSLAQTVH